MKSLLILISVFSAASAMANCRVEHTDSRGRLISVYMERECRDAMRECSRNRMSMPGSQCRIVTHIPTPMPGPGPGPIPGGGYTDYIYDFKNFMLDNCHVVTANQGYYNQVYVNGVFRGNYVNGRDDISLIRNLRSLVDSRACHYKTSAEINLMTSPGLIRTYEMGHYRNCRVHVDSSRRYYQFYINGTFRGNYLIYDQEPELRHNLARHAFNGTCR